MGHENNVGFFLRSLWYLLANLVINTLVDPFVWFEKWDSLMQKLPTVKEQLACLRIGKADLL